MKINNYQKCPYSKKDCNYTDMDGYLWKDCRTCKEYGNGKKRQGCLPVFTLAGAAFVAIVVIIKLIF